MQSGKSEWGNKTTKALSFSFICAFIGPLFSAFPFFLNGFEIKYLRIDFLLFIMLFYYPLAIIIGFNVAILFSLLCYYDIYKYGNIRSYILLINIFISTFFFLYTQINTKWTIEEFIFAFLICAFAAYGSVFVSRKFGVLVKPAINPAPLI